MAILTGSSRPHWNYFLALDNDLEKLSRYIEFDERNFKCFSLELARVLLAAASEIDVVAKQLCIVLNPDSTADNILAYRNEIIPRLPEIQDFRVVSPRFGLTLVPWFPWGEEKRVPEWWTAYNKVKHQRHSHYERANLKNTLNAVAGLLVLVLHLYRNAASEGELVPSPQVLRVHDDYIEGVTAGEYYTSPWYNLEPAKR